MSVNSLSDLLCDAGTRFPNRPALVTPTELLTYGELLRRALYLAGFLVESGLKPGDRVVICLPKGHELLTTIFGTLLAGGCYVPIDYVTPPSRIALIVRDAEPKAVICTAGAGQAIFNSVLSTSSISMAHSSGKQPFIFLLLDSYADKGDAVCAPWDQAMNSVALSSLLSSCPTSRAYILYTSGSTGRPKGVVHTHESALAFVNWAAGNLHLEAKDVLSQNASASFDLTIFDFFCSAKAAATLVSIPEWIFGQIAKTCRFIIEKGITIWYSVPSALLRREGCAGFSALSKSALRRVVFAGEVIPVNLLGEFITHLPSGCVISNWYGPTETNVVTHHDISASDLESDKCVPIGRPCPFAQIRIVPDAKVEEGTMRKGELLVASPTVMEGYWKLDDLTANVMMVSGDGQRFYQTGDLVTEDDYGRLIFLGRKDRLLKVRGYRLQPEEIEHVLQGHADVIEAAVVVIREAGLESIAGVVATTNFEDGFQKHLKKLCEDILPPYMVPSKIVRVEALPRGNRGKIDFRAIENIISLQPDAQRDGCG